MQKTDAVVRRETLYIASFSLILSALTEAVFLVLGKWDLTVLSGNLLGAATAVFNFFLMGRAVSRAVTMGEEDAKNRMKLSQALRTFLLFGIGAAGALLPWFHTVSLLVSFFFPRIAIVFRPLIGKKEEKAEEDPGEKGDAV